MDQPQSWYRNRLILPAIIIALAGIGVTIYTKYQQNNLYQQTLTNTGAVSNTPVNNNTAPLPENDNPNNKDISYGRPANFLSNLPITQSATCYFDTVTSTTFEDPNDPFADIEKRKISFKTEKQSKQNIVAFVDLDTPSPKLTANQGQGELVKLVDSPEVVTLIEKSPLTIGDNVVIYTIHKNEGVASWTKQYKLLSTPYALVSMGYCE